MLFPDPRPLVERLGQGFFRQMTERPGVYLMRDAAGLVLYVGKAKNLRKRLNNYRVANPDRLGRRHLRLLRLVERIEVMECDDEAGALAKEAELLLALKPKFNRAGIWVGPGRYLAWRCLGRQLELTVTVTPAGGWQTFGPCSSAAVYARAALSRLLWLGLNPELEIKALPSGWLRGRLGAVAVVPELCHATRHLDEATAHLEKLFAGDPEGFIAWVGKKEVVQKYEIELREADLEMVINFVQNASRRTKPFAKADQSTVGEEVNLGCRSLWVGEGDCL